MTVSKVVEMTQRQEVSQLETFKVLETLKVLPKVWTPAHPGNIFHRF